ncbi:OsmC family protein [Nocardia terpenica]|uniref:OsmC family protein n=1 Tax=Nocardia terpenica TaxID=455432 RepID=UPI0018934AAC|nr:OsmC family protein [Nocardia terpenica]MBF6059806.1 OsmC family protein [Nocardia terpenica]MBF6102653.1 OsmC family protein [Nocardia terpenica]MBF6111156.1 OsmC family protein [Nocardia terpenica]MBF6117287.1 OsmC family protein [Nocardia terpenica]MBF6150872.1 OsmC family protein [Nocardia terpenica]
MTDDSLRSVRIERTESQRYRVRNPRGGEIAFGSGDDADFTPVELLLAALGGCTAIDVDIATTRHAEPTEFTVAVSGNKIADELGSRLIDLEVRFAVTFPEGAEGDKASAILPRAAKASHDKLCTVSRTIEIGTPVRSTVESD